MVAKDAVIETPLKGTCEPRQYHAWLFANVKKSTVEVQDVFQSLNGDISIAVHSRYKWILNNDEVLEFGGVSIFEFTQDRKKIRKMTNFYDTCQVRASLDKANAQTAPD